MFLLYIMCNQMAVFYILCNGGFQKAPAPAWIGKFPYEFLGAMKSDAEETVDTENDVFGY